MMPEVFWTILLAALLELDTTYAFQLTLSRGIVAGPLLSLITGDLMAGVQVGALTELLFADINPLGGILPPSAVACCAVSLILHAYGVPLCVAFFFGVVCAILFAQVERWVRKNRSYWLARRETTICAKPAVLNRLIAGLLVGAFLFFFVFFAAFVLVCKPAALWLTEHLSDKALIAWKFAYVAVPWIGMTTLIASFRLKTK